MSFTRFVVALFLLSCFSIGCRSPYYGDRGAAYGGLTGAGVGAIIGNQSNNAAEGALLGGALGAISGGLVGNTLDDIDARNQQRFDNQLRDQAASSATIHDVIDMTQTGLGDDVIIQHVRQRGFVGSLTSNDLIYLKNKGASDQVIRAMQDLAGGPVPSRSFTPPPVFVEEHHYGPPIHPRYYFSRHRPRRGPGVGWHVALHN